MHQYSSDQFIINKFRIGLHRIVVNITFATILMCFSIIIDLETGICCK